MARFAAEALPAALSQPAGGMKGLKPRKRDVMPLREWGAGLVWGRPAPLPLGAPVLAGSEFSVFSTPIRNRLCLAVRPQCFSEEPMNPLSEIKRIRARSALGLWLLIGLWIFIGVFVLTAMGLHWEL
jgi:hypothetical protein